MSLRIRRGTNAQRTGVTLDLGEIAYTTDTKKLYVGDGITAGGINIIKECVGVGLEWDNTTQTITYTGAPSNALQSVSEDTNPQLGGNLNLNNKTINGTGTINFTGNISATALSLTTGMTSNLPLNGNDITGTGNVSVTGNVSATGTLTATTGLGGNLPLNGHDITGTGNVNISGTLSATQGLGANLPLNNKSITGTGNISIFGSVTSGTLNTGIINVTNNLVNGGVKIETNNSNLDSGFDLFTVNAFYNSSVFPASLILSRGRGTKAAPLAVQSGDVLGAFSFFGYTDSDTTKPAAIILASAVSPITTGNSGIVPGQVQFLVTNAAGDFDTELTIDAAGGVVANTSITPGVYADATARDATITSPVPGMLVYLNSDSKFYGYVDDAGLGSPGWVTLN